MAMFVRFGYNMPAMVKRRTSQLAESLGERRLVRFSRRFEDCSIHGYVLDIGPRFFLLALVSDGNWLDGFTCFRISDVSGLRPDPHSAVVEGAMKRRGERKPRKPRVSVESIETLLLSADRAFPLVTIHREQVDPDVCHIGRVVGITRGRVWLLEIGPDATWDTIPTEYRLSEITRVDFGGDYEDSLHLVGGSACPLARRVRNRAGVRPGKR